MQIALLPEWLLDGMPITREQSRCLNLLCSGVLVIGVVALMLDRLESVPHFCLFQRVLGIPCPGCGILHSLNASFHFNFRTAWHANPSGLALALALVFQVCGSALMLQGLPLSLKLEKLDSLCARVFGILAVAVWVYRVSTKFA
jgi:hypothetical protein